MMLDMPVAFSVTHEGLASDTWLGPRLAIAQADAHSAVIARRGSGPADQVETQRAAIPAAPTE